MPRLRLSILRHKLTIHQFEAATDIPHMILSSDFYALVRTQDELSIIAPTELGIRSRRSDADWIAMKIEAVLDLKEVGILSSIAAALRAANVGLFAISTFNTDYILVRAEKVEEAVSALRNAGYEIA